VLNFVRAIRALLICSHSGLGKPLLEGSDYLNTLLRDTTSSHLLETIFTRSPDDAFGVLWNLHLKGKLQRLSVHPVANFVVAKAFGRADEDQLLEACQELADSWQKIIGTIIVSLLIVCSSGHSCVKSGCFAGSSRSSRQPADAK
jgi:hypothetical protein